MSKYNRAEEAVKDSVDALNDALSELDRVLIDEISGAKELPVIQVEEAYIKVVEAKRTLHKIVSK